MCGECNWPEEKKQIRNIEIDECFSVRTSNLLRQRGVKYVNELTKVSVKTIVMEWKGFGKKSLNEVREVLSQLGLSLKGEVVDANIKVAILYDFPKILKEIQNQVNQACSQFDEACAQLKYLDFRLNQIREDSEKTRKIDSFKDGQKQ